MSDTPRRRLSRVGHVARALWAGDQHPHPLPPTPTDPAVVAMLRALGIAMLESGQAVNDVEHTLVQIARAHDAGHLRVVTLPTILIIQSPGTAEPIEVAGVSGRTMRLDQIGAIAHLVDRALRVQLDPVEVPAEVERIRRSGPRFGPWTTLAGHIVLSLGFGLVLYPTPTALPAYLLLGAVVGALTLLARRVPTLATALPVLAAFAVTVIGAGLMAPAIGDEPARVLAPALISLLPGFTLTIAALELTSNQVVAGASRIVYGIAQLLLLTFGVVAGLAVVGLPAASGTTSSLGWWAPWLGVALTAVGYLLFSSAPRGSFWWILLTLLVALGAQRVGQLAVGADLSGFVGAVVVVPFSRWVARFRDAPPSIVTMIPAFWLLVPGALGLVGFSEAAEGEVSALLHTGISLFSIALGMIVGTGISRDVGTVRRTWREAG